MQRGDLDGFLEFYPWMAEAGRDILLAWYQYELGREIAEAEKASSNPAAYGEIISQTK